jgi:hypothetical protein
MTLWLIHGNARTIAITIRVVVAGWQIGITAGSQTAHCEGDIGLVLWNAAAGHTALTTRVGHARARTGEAAAPISAHRDIRDGIVSCIMDGEGHRGIPLAATQ